MNRRYAIFSLAVATMIITLGFSRSILEEDKPLTCLACNYGDVVQKAPNETFTVMLSFKNTGGLEETWSVNVAFEGEAWIWSGTPENLTLKPCHTKTLIWNGRVPEDAPSDSTSRLIVYYDNSFEGLDWWIHVVEGAELEITSSIVK